MSNGSRPTEEQCSDHFNDLHDLADASGVAPEVLANWGRGELTDSPPSESPFPWESLDHLRQRAEEVKMTRSLPPEPIEPPKDPEERPHR
jgi:hypothetical protein